ncbi:hypothetical protein F5887DRAFT_900090 [Amanita rubescens]|nr:hypothetical protein F5887DRAFT_900090 [Amanita rubescens]
MKEIDLFLDEFIRLDGRGEMATDQPCRQCKKRRPEYRCRDCFSIELFCKECILEYHKRNPLHFLEFWNGNYFERVTLKSLDLRIQLGHFVDDPCPVPQPASEDSFVIIDSHGLHEVGLNFCGCGRSGTMVQQWLRYQLFPATVQNPTTAATFRALRYFQLLNFEAKCSAYDYFQTVLRETDNTGLSTPKDRYREFLRMSHEWRHLKMMKRAGCRHHSSTTEDGSCAILCPACPQPGINLQPGWENAPEETRWLYTLFLAMDANFRMTRKKVSNEERDPCLTQNRGYFVNSKDYQEHLQTHGGKLQAPSTCVSHDAVNSADTKDTRGLLVTGIGTVDCARHDMKRPNSVGDLQKGERYANMDYLFYSGLKNATIKSMVVSYDIACQWSIKFHTRMKTCFPAEWPINSSDVHLRFLVPKFHLPAHIHKCHQDFSFNYTPNVGRTEGEAPERGWSKINALSYSTKEMGPGSRQDTIEDHFNDMNWKKVIGIGSSLMRKLSAANHEKEKQYQTWNQFTEVLDPKQISIWLGEVQAWERDPTRSNPFRSRTNEPTQAEVRLRLAQQDMQNIEKNNKAVESHIGPSAMISMGIELEGSRHLQLEIASLSQHATPLQKAQFHEKLNTYYRKLLNWFEVQVIYIPAVATLRSPPSQNDRFDIHDIPMLTTDLWLPSGIGSRVPWDRDLGEYEWSMRMAQAYDALENLRQNLFMRDFLCKKKKDWSRGVRENTRSQTLIDRARAKVTANAAKYRIARISLGQLAPFLNKDYSWASKLRELSESDIEGLPAEGWGEGQRRLSWIWIMTGVDAGNGAQLQPLADGLRLQWCRARARALRWGEEISLIKEEMRRVLAYFTWYEQWWTEQADRYKAEGTQKGLRMALSEGLSAYAFRQADIRSRLREHFTKLWS